MNNEASTEQPESLSDNTAAAHYDQFFGPMFFEPYAMEIAHRIDPTGLSSVLELAAGTGRVTRHLQRRLLPGTSLIASDISESMLQQAKKQLHAPTIQWQFIDAQNIGLPENSIDLVVCAFGYMFVENKEKAMAEAYRVLKPGGSLLFTTWSKLEENAASHTSMLLAAEYLGIPIPASSLVATSMHNENELKMLLATAGFSAITTEKVQLFSVTSTAREAAAGFVKGGTLYKEIAKRFPEQIPSITLALENALAQKFGAAPMVAPISAIISRGWKK